MAVETDPNQDDAKQVFLCEGKDIKNTVKKSYADTIKHNTHVKSDAQHMASGSAKEAIKHDEQAPNDHSF